MKVCTLLVGLAVTLAAADFKPALPGYTYSFPRDHFDHPAFQTEWWYYTGNLRDLRGRRFGFELTFFRHGIARPTARSSPWQVDDLYIGHLALSDIGGNNFVHRQRINRSGPGIAGASFDQRRIWNGNWQVAWRGDTQELQAVAEEFTLTLALTSRKPPVIHGRDGVSQKAPGAGHASHYISLTRLSASGLLQLGGAKYELTGSAWMDHEFFTNQLTEDQAGWDWFSIQLENGAELMLGRLRRKDGTQDPYSHGTYVDPSGSARHLDASEFILTPETTWTSPATKASYPIHWTITVPALDLALTASTPMAQQELEGKGKLSPTYWEGGMDYQGVLKGKPINGTGYLEMTGYAAPVVFGQANRR